MGRKKKEKPQIINLTNSEKDSKSERNYKINRKGGNPSSTGQTWDGLRGASGNKGLKQVTAGEKKKP